MSDISSFLKFKVDELKKESPVVQTTSKPDGSPSLSQGIAKSSSFSKFKNAFEDGVGIMDTESVDTDKFRVNAELNALKSSNKIQSILDRKSTRLNSSHSQQSRMPSSA